MSASSSTVNISSSAETQSDGDRNRNTVESHLQRSSHSSYWQWSSFIFLVTTWKLIYKLFMFLIHILYFQLLSFFSFTVSYIFHIYLGWIHLYITWSTANIQIKKICIFACSQQDTYRHTHSLHITWFNAYLLLPYLIHVNVHYTIKSCHICRSIDEYFRSEYTFLVARGATMKITQYVHKVKEF